MSDKEKAEACEKILERIRREILPLIDKAINDDTVYFENPHLIQCWSKKNCTHAKCSLLGKETVRCWQTAGTYCGGLAQGNFVEKYHNCTQCDVFVEACPSLVEELGEYLNNLFHLLRMQKSLDKNNAERIEYLNRELISSLSNLDNKNREIQELVITDKLTGLYNRHYLLSVLEDELFRCERKEYIFSLLMLDIDDFKSINDIYGHLSGDAMLSELGIMIKNVLRKYDRCFRYGGEEFVIVLPETDMTIAWMIAERLRKQFSQKNFMLRKSETESPESVSRTVSIGCTTHQAGMTINQLLEVVDEALYTAKSGGKNQVVRSNEF
jgi:diguanylate cyclase (GGDEF)-like protein